MAGGPAVPMKGYSPISGVDKDKPHSGLFRGSDVGIIIYFGSKMNRAHACFLIVRAMLKQKRNKVSIDQDFLESTPSSHLIIKWWQLTSSTDSNNQISKRWLS